jgi:2-C-methyl-D-erythritol 4-phosphate cytidylyltransferase
MGFPSAPGDDVGGNTVFRGGEHPGIAGEGAIGDEQIFLIDVGCPDTTVKYIPRETLRRVATPQAYQFGLLSEKYREAFEKKIGIYGSSYTNTMMTELGVRLYFAAGSDRNIKLTTSGDIEIFKAMIAEGK